MSLEKDENALSRKMKCNTNKLLFSNFQVFEKEKKKKKN